MRIKHVHRISLDENQVRKFFRRILPCPHLRSPSHLRAFLGSGFVLSFSSTASSKVILNSIICNPSSDIPETFYPVKNQSTIQPEPMVNGQSSEVKYHCEDSWPQSPEMIIVYLHEIHVVFIFLMTIKVLVNFLLWSLDRARQILIDRTALSNRTLGQSQIGLNLCRAPTTYSQSANITR